MMKLVKTPSKTEHFQYDVCNCKTCLEEADKVEYGEDVPKKKKGSQKSLKKRYEARDPSVGLLGEPSGKFDYYVLYAEFPALTTFKNPQQKTKHSWKIQSSNVVGLTGSPNQITAAEATLNRQSENVVAQNNVLKTILAQKSRFNQTQKALFDKVHSLENIIYEVRSKILELHNELLEMVRSDDELASNHEFEHLFMVEPEQTERVDSDIEYATSRTEAQDQAQGRNVLTNNDSKQQFTFDDIPPSKWRERSVRCQNDSTASIELIM
ncbi:hypothetical protein L1987_32553 [Smallanthus sonchifolius]|uniref:Uncharacterized protein n=1 Tax=Smallanthus sonchifolius TaxID=185202 RepID=A0ACB9HNV6_9ASTR|nr:hypothetical protein L1987_32553 [Smallanthus sonchifolius]